MKISKKTWLTMGLLPLAIAPLITVASCTSSTTYELTDDAKGAMLNNEVKFKENIRLFKGFLPTEQNVKEGVMITQKDGTKKPFNFILEPRQNFGFVTEIVGEENDNDAGVKIVKLKLTRGKVSYEQNIKLENLLTNETKANEDDPLLNVEKVFKEKHFNREEGGFEPIQLESQQNPDGTWPILIIEDYLKKGDKGITEEFKNRLLEGKQNQGYDLEIVNLHQKTQNGIKINEIVAEVRLIKKEGNTVKKSGLYILNFKSLGNFKNVRNGLRTVDFLKQYAYAFSTINTPVKELTDPINKLYSDRKASEFEWTETISETEKQQRKEELFKELKGFDDDKITFKKWPMFVYFDSIGNANDEEGSLEVTFKFKWQPVTDNGSTPDDKMPEDEIKLPLKLYGFKLN